MFGLKKELKNQKIDREPKKPWGRRKGAGLYIHDFEKDEVKWK